MTQTRVEYELNHSTFKKPIVIVKDCEDTIMGNEKDVREIADDLIINHNNENIVAISEASVALRRLHARVSMFEEIKTRMVEKIGYLDADVLIENFIKLKEESKSEIERLHAANVELAEALKMCERVLNITGFLNAAAIAQSALAKHGNQS